ncbi:sugar-transfer associated ATP-grasp domain-containing protein [Ancrocorticia populi]|uniref:Alpha-L-glutamate ligase-related protein ATP-grasp domain-containing protein n=1 Tax=Ancrocorticia populi TaxID=2175228 RepID=A0A2V1K7G2_9ACTO|nr:sugar-transfer associated ATP-grasp domain-containing protein [Ancrocorticia populi]PWF27386.1 hypothetical protein DD236_03095 [Ancrocorticia populi]
MMAKKAQELAQSIAISAITADLVRQGFGRKVARRSAEKLYRDWHNGDSGANQSQESIIQLGAFHSPLGRSRASSVPSAISRQDFHLLGSPNNNLRWLHNRAVARRTSESLRLAMPTFYCLFKWNDDLTVTRIGSDSDQLDASEAGLLALIRREGIVRLLPASWSHGVGSWLSFDGQTYAIDGEIKSPDGLLEHLHQASAGQSMILASGEDAMRTTGEALGYADAVIRLYIAKDSSGLAKVVDSFLEVDSGSHSTPLTAGDRFAQEIRIDQSSGALQDSAVIPNFSQLKAEIESVFSEDCLGFRFISVDVSLTGEGYLIEDIARSPEYPRASQFSDEANALLLGLLQERIQKLSEQPHIGARAAGKAGEKAERYRRRIEAFQLRSIGFTGRMARNWVNRVEDDKRQDDQFSAAHRKAAHRLGYMPATAARLGISERNAEDFISERDYSYIHPLNGKYAKWVRDRASALEIFKPFIGLFEDTHYQFLWRDGDIQILPLSPRAQNYAGTVSGLAQFLINELGTNYEVALVPSAYTGGVRLAVSYTGSRFVVNGTPYTHDEFHMLLRRRVRRRSFVLIDPAEADRELSAQFPDAVSSIKVIMMNPDGATPQVAEAFVDVRQAVDVDTLVRASIEVEEGAHLQEAESEIEAQLALQQDVDDADEISGPTADDWSEIEPEAQPEVGETDERKVHFLSRIDPLSGEYKDARAIVDQRLYTFESDPVGGQPFQGLIGQWPTIVERLTEMCRFAPQLEFVEFTLAPNADAFKITHVSAMPSYGYVYPFSPKTVAFLKGRVAMKKADMRNASKRARRWLHNAKLRIRKSFGQAVYPKGLVPYQSVRWIGDVVRDFREPNGISVRKKLWAYRNGLLSYRITQYGITKENREDFISDLEYRWLRHINKKYKYWLEDKISIKYVASQFNECFPGYYYFTSLHDGENKVIPMMDCPESFGADFDEILRLAREKGVLALKPDEGSHGDGFYRLDYVDGGYTLNGEPATADEVKGILADPTNQYLITEFIQTHPDLAEIYPKAVNTIRMIVFKRDGVTPQIGTAYFRIGTEASGFVDNTAQGGMLAQIDIDSGEFGNAQVLKDGYVQPCPVHPDSGVLIEGVIPNWDYVKSTVLGIAASMQQLEYLGFDLAITPDGIKLPEINRFPDYPRIQKLTPETIEYLLYKVEQKKKETGYHHRRRALIDLPPRSTKR